MYDDDDDEILYDEERQPHSELSIASFIISLILGIALFALLMVTGVVSAMNNGKVDEHTPFAMVIGLLFILGLLIATVGATLGIVALCQQNRKKVFALLVFSSMHWSCWEGQQSVLSE